MDLDKIIFSDVLDGLDEDSEAEMNQDVDFMEAGGWKMAPEDLL